MMRGSILICDSNELYINDSLDSTDHETKSYSNHSVTRKLKKINTVELLWFVPKELQTTKKVIRDNAKILSKPHSMDAKRSKPLKMLKNGQQCTELVITVRSN